MTITVYTGFSKRKNSTKQPTGGTQKTVTLKEGTSIESPTFVLQSNDFTINYVKAFDHYYFVDDIKSVRNNLIEVICSMDVLATFKSQIGSYNALIERSASFYDPLYPDPAITIKDDISTAYATSAISHLDDDGYFALTVLNNKGSQTGFMVTYFVKDTTLRSIAQYVNTDWGAAATDFLSWLQATFLRTADCIIDCRWLPIDSTAFSSDTVSENIDIGVDTLTVTGERLAYPHVAVTSGSITIPHVYTDFRKYAPYTVGKLYIPCYGVVDINTLDFDNDTIYYKYYIDPQTGDAAVFLAADSSYNVIVSTYTFNISVQCPVGRVGNDVLGFMASGLTTSAMVAGAMALPNKFTSAAAVATGASAINTLGSMLGATSSVHGTMGGRVMSYDLTMVLGIEYKDTQTLSSVQTEAGRPCMEQHVLNTCSGYVKCVNASVDIPGMSEEKTQVNDFLNSGFYYE